MTMISANPALYAQFYKRQDAHKINAQTSSGISLAPLLINLKGKILQATNMNELAGIFQQATGGDRGLKQINQLSFSLGETKILIANEDLATRLDENLKKANSLGIQAAPILVETLQTKDPDLKIVITLEPGIHGDINQLCTFATASLNGALDPRAKNLFYKDIEELFTAGFINPSILSDRTSLKINPKSGLIFASNWENLDSTTGVDKGEYLNEIKKILGIN